MANLKSIEIHLLWLLVMPMDSIRTTIIILPKRENNTIKLQRRPSNNNFCKKCFYLKFKKNWLATNGLIYQIPKQFLKTTWSWFNNFKKIPHPPNSKWHFQIYFSQRTTHSNQIFLLSKVLTIKLNFYLKMNRIMPNPLR